MQTELRYERWYLPYPCRLDHIPVASITRADVTEERAFTAGVHYSSGRWLVNGSGNGLVTLPIEPPVKVKAAFRSVKLRSLVVSVTDPEALIAACTVSTP